MYMNNLQKFIEENKDSIIAEPSGLTLKDLRDRTEIQKILLIDGKL